jgi:molybdenum cofactor cytidylyltransferase
MRFGEIPLDEAEGAVLAHAFRAGGLAFAKGRRLSAEDVAALRAEGAASVVAAKPEPGDVPEDEAAARLARAVMGEGVEAGAASTGRVNLFAGRRGLLLVDVERLDRLNLIDESLTVATLPPFEPVEPRRMVATVKVIPFAAPEAAVAAAEAVGRLVRVAPFRRLRAALVQTRLPGTKESVLDKTVRVTRDRLEALGCTLDLDLRGPHETDWIAGALASAREGGADLLLAIGASAITDRRDVLPAGVERAGGSVEHFGMPVDPGNLLLLARLGDAPMLGLPGCARSPKPNGFDWVLQRLVAGVPVTRADVMRMGAGGLLIEIPTRPLPRASAAPAPAPPLGPGPEPGPARPPKVAALVLAAGRSSRMGANKLLAAVEGRPMLRHAVEAALASRAGPVLVVTGHEREGVEAALAGLPVSFVHSPAHAEGLSASLKAGIAALPPDVDAAVVCLGDMPRVAAGVVDRLIESYAPAEGRAVCVPTHAGKRGNPVLWDRRFFAEILDLRGDVGARHLIGAHADQVAEVPVEDAGVLLDVDTPAALAALRDERTGREEAPPQG